MGTRSRVVTGATGGTGRNEQNASGAGRAFEQLTDRGVLRIKDSSDAAGHFAMLVIGRALDKSLFSPDQPFSATQLRNQARSGVVVFLSAYGPDNP
jgi:hypothetical protein